MREQEKRESGKVLVLEAVLMGILILVSIGGVIWMMQMIQIQIGQFNAALLSGFGM